MYCQYSYSQFSWKAFYLKPQRARYCQSFNDRWSHFEILEKKNNLRFLFEMSLFYKYCQYLLFHTTMIMTNSCSIRLSMYFIRIFWNILTNQYLLTLCFISTNQILIYEIKKKFHAKLMAFDKHSAVDDSDTF